MPGFKGTLGEPGFPGQPGREGRRGQDGFKGQRGDPGDFGPAGPVGLPGIDGDPGRMGFNGEPLVSRRALCSGIPGDFFRALCIFSFLLAVMIDDRVLCMWQEYLVRAVRRVSVESPVAPGSLEP